MVFTLENFLVYHPDVQSSEFPYFIAESKEYSENKIPVVETKPTERGELLSQQKLVKRFISPNTPYSKLLLFHKVGVGKMSSSG